jgi:hypothetical protein
LHTEQQFNRTGVGKLKRAAQGVFDVVFDPAHGPQNRNSRRSVNRAIGFAAPHYKDSRSDRRNVQHQ